MLLVHTSKTEHEHIMSFTALSLCSINFQPFHIYIISFLSQKLFCGQLLIKEKWKRFCHLVWVMIIFWSSIDITKSKGAMDRARHMKGAFHVTVWSPNWCHRIWRPSRSLAPMWWSCSRTVVRMRLRDPSWTLRIQDFGNTFGRIPLSQRNYVYAITCRSKFPKEILHHHHKNFLISLGNLKLACHR